MNFSELFHFLYIFEGYEAGCNKRLNKILLLLKKKGNCVVLLVRKYVLTHVQFISDSGVYVLTHIQLISNSRIPVLIYNKNIENFAKQLY
jgi:ketopantoate hydroxymethyltransferase